LIHLALGNPEDTAARPGALVNPHGAPFFFIDEKLEFRADLVDGKVDVIATASMPSALAADQLCGEHHGRLSPARDLCRKGPQG